LSSGSFESKRGDWMCGAPSMGMEKSYCSMNRLLDGID
jgi:hypothetical protein